MSPLATRLWNRSFIIWLVGTAQSQLGTALAGIALSFLVLHQTGSAGKMAVTLAFTLIPNLFMPLAGAWVDRVNLKLPLIGADVARGAFQLVVGGLALWWGEVPLWLVNSMAFLTGLANIFAAPASGAATPKLVPENELARANGLIGSISQGAWLVGTLAGGWIVAQFSPPLAIVLDGLSFWVMAVALLFVKFPPASQTANQSKSLFSDLKAGLNLMRRSRILSFVPVMAFGINAVNAPIMVVTPKLMETLGAGAKGYGTFLALESLGLMLSGLLIATLGQRLNLRFASTGGFAIVALSFALLWRFPTVPPMMFTAVLLGFGLGVLNTPFMTMLQQAVPANFLGRIFSVLSMTASVGMPLTLLLISPMLDRLPLPNWYGFGALGMLLGGAAWISILLSERELPDFSDLEMVKTS